MSEDVSLFGDEPPIVSSHRADPLLPAWEVDSLRKALDRMGLTSMVERQRFVEQTVGRSIGALRELLPHEAGRLRDELHRRARQSSPDTKTSEWDERDEATWIDRM